MKISYNYSTIYAELASDACEFGIELDTTITIFRELRQDTNYQPIIDYILPGQPLNEEDITEDVMLEHVTLKEVLDEMIEYSRII